MTEDSSKPDQSSKPESDEARRKSNMLKAGIGIGIGSAAVVAALLYANKKKDDSKPKPRAEPKDRD